MTEEQKNLKTKKKFLKSIEQCFHKLDLDDFESKITQNGNWFRGWILPNGKMILTISHYDLMNSNINGGHFFETERTYDFYNFMLTEYGFIRFTMAKNWIKHSRAWDTKWDFNIHLYKWTKEQSDTIYRILNIDMFAINSEEFISVGETSSNHFTSGKKAWNYLNNRIETI